MIQTSLSLKRARSQAVSAFSAETAARLLNSNPEPTAGGGIVHMRLFGKITRVFALLVVMAIYLTGLWMGMTEQSRRSIVIVKSAASSDDFVVIDLRVVSVDMTSGLLHERVRLVPTGRFAIDQATPATDLKLLINSVSGKQTVVFPKGERIFPIEFDSLLSGNQSRYPFDSYVTDIELLVTAPAQRRVEIVPEEIPLEADPLATTLVIGPSELSHSETVPIKETFSASIPGIRFDGTVVPDGAYKVMRTAIAMRRARNVIIVSLVVMTVMFVLALSIMAMVLRVTASPGEINLLPLSLCVALIFGLPALRSIQPGVPGIGVFGDYFSFIWAELIVSISAVTLAWIWIIRAKQTPAPEAAVSDSETQETAMKK